MTILTLCCSYNFFRTKFIELIQFANKIYKKKKHIQIKRNKKKLLIFFHMFAVQITHFLECNYKYSIVCNESQLKKILVIMLKKNLFLQHIYYLVMISITFFITVTYCMPTVKLQICILKQLLVRRDFKNQLPSLVYIDINTG